MYDQYEMYHPAIMDVSLFTLGEIEERDFEVAAQPRTR